MTVCDNEGNLRFVSLDAILENRKILEILTNSYKTQEKTPRKLPPGVARYLTGFYASERGSGYRWNTEHYGTRNRVLSGAVYGPYI